MVYDVSSVVAFCIIINSRLIERNILLFFFFLFAYHLEKNPYFQKYILIIFLYMYVWKKKEYLFYIIFILFFKTTHILLHSLITLKPILIKK